MGSQKELLTIKKNIRKGLPANNTEISKLLLKIFTLKFKITDKDFKSKVIVSSTDNIPVDEFPLSDKNLIVIYTNSDVNTKLIYKILMEISDDNVTVNYAPLLFPLISFLMSYLSNAETIGCVEQLLSSTEMMPATKNDWNIFCHLLYFLARRFATKAFKHIDKYGDADNFQICYWPYTVWYLPANHLTRIVPCYLVEGIKILYRAGLLIWKECVRRYSNELDLSNLKDLMIKTARTIDQTYNPQQFLNRMFRIRNFGRDNIERLRVRLTKPLKNGEWISPTATRGYIAFKRTHSNPSRLVTHDELIEIIEKLDPILSQINKPIPLFWTNSHGYSLTTLYDRAEHAKETLLILETAKGEIIGAFCTDPWTMKNRPEPKRYYGKGGCFIFRIRPRPAEFIRWKENRDKPNSDLFQRATNEALEIGGGGKGASISVDRDIAKGSSYTSSTFNNSCLTPYSNHDFYIRSLELLAFAEMTVD